MTDMQVSYPFRKDGTMRSYTQYTTADGRHWREASPAELATLPSREPDHMVHTGHGASRAGDFADLVFAGGYPFLAGFAALRPVYVEIICLEEGT